jgi:hypothetical protein
MPLDRIEDRLEIQAVLYRHARGVDRRAYQRLSPAADDARLAYLRGGTVDEPRPSKVRCSDASSICSSGAAANGGWRGGQ